jgi:hypothetical protein
MRFFHLFVAVCRAAKYLIGTEQNSGAWEIADQLSAMNLAEDCFEGKICPPVVIFTGMQSGTLSVSNCEEGVLYSFINRSDSEYGIVIQDATGLYGSKAISQFGLGQCFCHRDSVLLCG